MKRLLKLELKSLEALIRGYILFDVNGLRFISYGDARDYRKFLSSRRKLGDSISFKGFHIFKGWRSFYYAGPVRHVMVDPGIFYFNENGLQHYHPNKEENDHAI